MKLRNSFRKIFIGAMLYFFMNGLCAGAEKEERTSSFDQRWLKAVVSLELLGEKERKVPIGTGFLIASPKGHIILVTAKHIIEYNQDRLKNLGYRLNIRNSESILVTEAFLESLNMGTWFLSEEDDVACRFILVKEHDSDVLQIPSDLFLLQKDLEPGTPLFILGFPLGLRSTKYAVPIVRKAIIASSSPILIIDGFVFPGNSGGPVLYVPSVTLGKGFSSSLVNGQRLAGMVLGSISYRDTACSLQTKRPRIIFEENTGLTKIVPTDAILSLIKRDDVKQFDEKVTKILDKIVTKEATRED